VLLYSKLISSSFETGPNEKSTQAEGQIRSGI
jgi:hypothetical protein